jgi:hypothetical protein
MLKNYLDGNALQDAANQKQQAETCAAPPGSGVRVVKRLSGQMRHALV